MIQIRCRGCKTELLIDEGFAGGACRCQYCGTIQTVPRTAPRSARAMAPQQAPEESGLDDLVQAVAEEEVEAPLHAAKHRKPPEKKYTGWIIAIIIAGLAACWALYQFLVLAPLKLPPTPQKLAKDTPPATLSPPSNAPSKGPEAAAPAPVKIVPNYMGAEIKGASVVYLLDRGHGTIDTFEALKGATVKSLESLGAKGKFRVVFWLTEKPAMFPEKGMATATAENIAACKTFMADIIALGQSRIEGPLEAALKEKPEEIVIASGKGMLDKEFVDAVLKRCKVMAVKVHTFSVGGYGSPAALKAIAEQTGGEFREVKGPEVREYSSWSP